MTKRNTIENLRELSVTHCHMHKILDRTECYKFMYNMHFLFYKRATNAIIVQIYL